MQPIQSVLFDTITGLITLMVLCLCITEVKKQLSIVINDMKKQSMEKRASEIEVELLIETIKEQYPNLSEESLKETAHDIIKRKKYLKNVKISIYEQITEIKKTTLLTTVWIDHIFRDYDDKGIYYGYRSDYSYLNNSDYTELLQELRLKGYRVETENRYTENCFSGITHYYSNIKVSWVN